MVSTKVVIPDRLIKVTVTDRGSKRRRFVSVFIWIDCGYVIETIEYIFCEGDSSNKRYVCVGKINSPKKFFAVKRKIYNLLAGFDMEQHEIGFKTIMDNICPYIGESGEAEWK